VTIDPLVLEGDQAQKGRQRGTAGWRLPRSPHGCPLFLGSVGTTCAYDSRRPVVIVHRHLAKQDPSGRPAPSRT
jgi:hypothetical protein